MDPQKTNMLSANFPNINTLSKEAWSLTKKENTEEKSISEIHSLYRCFT